MDQQIARVASRHSRLLMYIASWPRVKARWASSTRFRAIGAAAAVARLHPLSNRNSFVQMCSRRAMLFFYSKSRLPVAHRPDGCDLSTLCACPEKRLRMYIASASISTRFCFFREGRKLILIPHRFMPCADLRCYRALT